MAGLTHRFASLSPLLTLASVAVLGASSDTARIGGRPIAYMLRQNFTGRILPVNPNRTEIQGLPAFQSVASLPEVPDVAVVEHQRAVRRHRPDAAQPPEAPMHRAPRVPSGAPADCRRGFLLARPAFGRRTRPIRPA